MYKAYCVMCGNFVKTFNKKTWFNKFVKNGSLCQYCKRKKNDSNKFIGKCILCKKKRTFKVKSTYLKAKERNFLCSSCSRNKLFENGYVQSEETISKIKTTLSKTMKGRNTLNENWSKLPLIERKEKEEKRKGKISKATAGKNNPMYGKKVYDIWVKKYGATVANRKLTNLKSKISIATSGENNPMYGKPSPTGSGNGWSGWFNKIYFRSLLELSFIVHMVNNNIEFECAEKREYAIPYKLDGKNKNYFCDFYLNVLDIFIEVKPKNLLNTRLNKLKFDSAKSILGNRFTIKTEEDFHQLENDEIITLYTSGILEWLPRYEKKFILKYGDKLC